MKCPKCNHNMIRLTEARTRGDKGKSVKYRCLFCRTEAKSGDVT